MTDLAPLVRWAAEAGAGNPLDYLVARTRGAVHYRAGKFEEACEQFRTASTLQKAPTPTVWLLLALSHARLKQEEAGRWLDRAIQWMNQAQAGKPGESQDPFAWHMLSLGERVALQTLRCEAEELLRGKKKKNPG
jgi:predicted Zn-dependent protease